MTDYTAWLVEINEPVSGPLYYQLRDDNDWTLDQDAALHLGREEDAQRIIDYYGWTRAKAVEHMWPASGREAHEVNQLRDALAPFAAVADSDIGQDETDTDVFKPIRSGHNRAPLITVGDMRRALSVSRPHHLAPEK